MITDAMRRRLARFGIFCTDAPDARHRSGFNPFFTFDPESVAPTEEELSLLVGHTLQYRTTRFSPSETRDQFWGDGANTITFRKRADGWQFRRMTWENPNEWAPQPPGELEDALYKSSR